MCYYNGADTHQLHLRRHIMRTCICALAANKVLKVYSLKLFLWSQDHLGLEHTFSATPFSLRNFRVAAFLLFVVPPPNRRNEPSGLSM